MAYLESTLKDDLIDQLSLLCGDIKFPNDDDMISDPYLRLDKTVGYSHRDILLPF